MELVISDGAGRLAIAEPESVSQVHLSIMSAREEVKTPVQGAKEEI